jgi:hypothetical protein
MSTKFNNTIFAAALILFLTPVFAAPPEGAVRKLSTELCGDANCNGAVGAILDITYIINHLYHNGPDFCNDYNADVNSDGAINILDIIALIRYTYQGGTIECRNIRDDFPTASGSWWQYRRHYQNEDTYDTVYVGVVGDDTLEYVYPDRTDTVRLIFPDPEIVDVIGTDPYTRYDFFINPGEVWFYPDLESGYYEHADTVVARENITVPAGTFAGAYRIFRWTYFLEKSDPPEYTLKFGDEWFKAGVGTVKRVKSFYKSATVYTWVWELIDYYIDLGE